MWQAVREPEKERRFWRSLDPVGFTISDLVRRKEKLKRFAQTERAERGELLRFKMQKIADLHVTCVQKEKRSWLSSAFHVTTSSKKDSKHQQSPTIKAFLSALIAANMAY